MYIRCAICQAATWVETLEPGAAGLTVSCQECDQEYSLLAAGELGTSEDEQYQRSRQFAEYNGIDLPSAYSVLLGLMNLDEAQAARQNRVRQTKDVATFTEDAGEKELPYDKEFHPAVAEGILTVQQAMNRGGRRALATRLCQRHGLPMELAFRVADNRLSLAEARLQRPHAGAVPVSAQLPSRSHKALLLGFAAFVVLAVAVQAWRSFQHSDAPPSPVAVESQTPQTAAEEPGPVAAATASANVETDAQGQLVEITGPDPRSVLIAYCTTGPEAGRFEPVELTRTVPHFAGSRLGVVRDTEAMGTLQAIKIRRDNRTHRWVAGNGRDPIPRNPLPETPPEGMAIPVTLE